MTATLTAILTVFLAFIASTALTHLYIGAARGHGPVALPNHRSMHKGVVIVGGGLPLLISTILLAALFWRLGGAQWAVVAAATGLALVSYIDDTVTVPARLRFAAHTAAALVAVALVPPSALLLGGVLPFWLDRAVVLLALVWFINLYNFMDGIDGIAGVQTAALAAGYVMVVAVSGGPAPFFGLALALAGAAVGFLFWNWHPARVFMGDVGSVPLGLLTGAMMMDLAAHHSLAAALILPLYYSADATITLLTRLMDGEKVWEAHRRHAYQRAAKSLGSHAVVVRRVAACNVALVGCAVLALSRPVMALGLALVAVGALLAWMEITANREPLRPADRRQ
ncbi:MAG: glycosyltransferase family 4 protein [Hyphomicrobiaceae bacterium]|nr:glycosyltransferase family 4 protein [Hyphomicrobiaceae bacterium]